MSDPSMAAGDDEDMQDPGAMGDPDAGADDQGGQVICTIVHNSDGTFTMYEGDEPEEDEGAEASEGSAGGEAGGPGAEVPPGQAPEEPEGAGAEGPSSLQAAPAGEHYDNVGELMRAVLEVVKHADEGDQGVEGSFKTGFDQDSPLKPPTNGGDGTGKSAPVMRPKM